ncbi:hypothetical protein DM02DRAFT_730214 [Periconia macrospinosa]|uniref:Nephrocystin 3-like N-terminal domain-containing protein n=1 Tax=Periconia macrospinosa TaxID=97972 RepID=A0A2V1DJ73_9PLEO|nr:hypothetical protein DM02DRAFT_730214 [Periconia macrospinosa]
MKEDGSRVSTSAAVIKTMWKPFEVRYREIVDCITLNAEIVQQELNVMQLEYKTARDKQWDAQLANATAGIARTEKALEVLNERMKKEKLDYGTSEWLAKNATFKEWDEMNLDVNATGVNVSEVDTVLLVKGEYACYILAAILETDTQIGNPGYGKTVLAAATIDNLSKRSDGEREVLYFFFRAGSGTLESRLDAYCALLTRILQNHKYDPCNDDEGIMEKLSFAMQENDSGQFNRPTEDTALELLVMCAGLVMKEGRIVLDAVDECIDSDELLADMRRLSKRTGIKILLFSRPNLKALYSDDGPRFKNIMIERESSNDVELLLDGELLRLEAKKLFPQSYDKGTAIKRLVKRADGMILWAHLMVTYLSIQALSPNQRLEAVTSTSDPKGIDEMYDRLATAIFEQSDIEGSMAKRMIMMLAFATHDLTSDDLEVALKVADGIFSLSKEDRVQNFDETVITICGGIIEPVQLYSPIHGQNISSFQFIHLSARHYFVENSTAATLPSLSSPGRAFLFASETLSHLQIAQLCVALLRNCAPGTPFCRETPPRTNLDKPSALENTKPFVRYATRSWIKHLAKADIKKLREATDRHHLEVARQLMKDLDAFLCNPAAISAWIEEAYRTKYKLEAQTLAEWVSKLLQQRQPPNGFDTSILKLSLELSQDLQKLERFWGRHLWKEPGCIWDEASAFMNSKFLLKSSATQPRSIVRATADDDTAKATCNTCLCKISSTNESGDLAAVLSVWPSRYTSLSSHWMWTRSPVIRPVGSMLLQYASPPSAANIPISLQTTVGKVQQSPNTIPTHTQLVSTSQALASAGQVSSSASRGITVSHTDSRITLGAWSRQGTTGTRAALEVLKIPQPTGLDRRSVAVHLPRGRFHHEDKLRVIMNLATRPWNDLDGSLDNASPLLILRDLAAIRDSRALGELLRIGNGGEGSENLGTVMGERRGLDVADRWMKVDDQSVGSSWDEICGKERDREEAFVTGQGIDIGLQPPQLR